MPSTHALFGLAAVLLSGLWLAGCQADHVDIGCGADDDCLANETCDSDTHLCQTRGEEPLLLDDFEDGDSVPSAPEFQIWQHYSYNPSGQDVDSTPSPVAQKDSNYGMEVTFFLEDEANGVNADPGGGIRSLANEAFVDLSRFSRVVFDVAYQATDPDCVPLEFVTVRIACSEHNAVFMLNAEPGSDYETVTLQLKDFSQPFFLPENPEVDWFECFGVADGIDFQFQPRILDGECGAGRLYFDNFSFR